VSVLSADHLERVDWMSMTRCRERSLENRIWGTRSGVPEEDLSRISSANDQIWVEWREAN